MKPVIAIAWHLGGLACALTGVYILWGWPGIMIAFGLWAMIGTVLDTVTRR